MRHIKILFLGLLFLFSCINAAFQTETVDSSALSRYPSIGVGPDGMPQIVYGGNTSELIYTYWDGTKWVSNPLGKATESFVVASIAVDSSNNPHICYATLKDYDTVYLFWNGNSWETQIVDSEGKVGGGCSIALDGNNAPRMAYLDVITDDLKYAALSGGSWKIQKVDEDVSNSYFSFAIDNAGNPGIIYFKKRALQYAHYDGSAWRIEQVLPEKCIADQPSIAFDSKGNPGISYHECYDPNNSSGNDLEYAYLNGNSWSTQSVAQKGSQGPKSILKFDPSDRPHIFYQNENDKMLSYASWDGEKWNVSMVSWYSVPPAISFALDSKGNPNLVYTNDKLKYATLSKSSATSASTASKPSESSEPPAASEETEETQEGGACGSAFILVAALGAFFLNKE